MKPQLIVRMVRSNRSKKGSKCNKESSSARKRKTDEVPTIQSPECSQTTSKRQKRSPARNSDDSHEAYLRQDPYHVDKSTKKHFYSEVDIHDGESFWTLSLGDDVAIHVFSNKSSDDVNNTYPLDVPWFGGEVLSIFTRQTMKSQSNKKNKSIPFNSVKIEVRWLYRLKDIPGIIQNSSSITTPESCMKEILETDEVAEIDADSIICPIYVHSDAEDQYDDTTSDSEDTEGLHFYCHRLWSVHRKSLLPIGTYKNRFKRGMMYSSYLGPRGVARQSFEQMKNGIKKGDVIMSDRAGSDNEWKRYALDALKRLSLSQASIAIEDERSSLIGREKEQEKVARFLRSAIKGVNTNLKEQASKFSLFIAGPPGVGKTATVRSVIATLRQEQSEGRFPQFQFISLNGMEMRHPFDAYVRLWEALSPSQEKCAPGEAAARLELHFAGDDEQSVGNGQTRMSNRDAVVLLIDEMDYLVTKKETVLYNLFDWPTRSQNGSSQLIVIGISNTLNLPERLHPRVQSRLGNERCIYRAYKEEDSVKIFKAKVPQYSSLFREDAVRFAAKKMAANSGDLRRFFQLTKIALENLLSDVSYGRRKHSTDDGLIKIDDIQKASREMFDTIISKAISHATSFEALLFVSLASLKRKSGCELGGFEVKDVLVKMSGVASAFGDDAYLPAPTYQELLDMLNRLNEASIITLQTPNGGHYYGSSGASNTRIILSLDDYEVLNALQNTYHCKLAEKHLGRSILF